MWGGITSHQSCCAPPTSCRTAKPRNQFYFVKTKVTGHYAWSEQNTSSHELVIQTRFINYRSLINNRRVVSVVSVLQYLTGPRFVCPYKIHFDGFQHRLTFAVNKKFLIFNLYSFHFKILNRFNIYRISMDRIVVYKWLLIFSVHKSLPKYLSKPFDRFLVSFVLTTFLQRTFPSGSIKQLGSKLNGISSTANEVPI